jgi:KamA family protein
LITVNSLSNLESLLNISYDIPNRDEFNEYIFQHPLRFTEYLLEQIKKYPSVAKQYIPDPRELEPAGENKPFTGVLSTGIPGLERMYLDRVILMPSSQCFAYCRFCFRKNYSHDIRDGDYGNPQDNFEKALNYIREDDRIREVLITGGDPLMFPHKVLELIEKLRKIPHLTAIRIGSRIFTSDPERINMDWIKPFRELNTIPQTPKALQTLKAPISISPHINHPDELSIETQKALLLCTQNNIPLYNQTVLLKDINDDAETLIDLNRKLRQLGVEPYRIYQADPLQGTNYLRTPLRKTIHIKNQMRAQASGRVVPDFILETRIGKVDVNEGVILREKNQMLWIKTPYTPEIYQQVHPEWKLPDYCELAEDGSIIAEWEDASQTSDLKNIKQAQRKKPPSKAPESDALLKVLN